MLCCVAAVQAQSVDEILDNYFENTGGRENWENLNNMKMNVKMVQGGFELTGVMFRARPNLQKQEIEFNGKKIINAYDGTNAWMVNPLAMATEPTLMPEEQAAELKEDEFEDPFLNYKDKGHTVELEGTETIEGTETYKVKLTKKNGSIEYYFFDSEYFVPIMTRRFAKTGPAKGQAMDLYLSDYDEEGGFMVPHTIVTKANGQTAFQISIDSYEMNVDLPADTFTFPGK